MTLRSVTLPFNATPADHPHPTRPAGASHPGLLRDALTWHLLVLALAALLALFTRFLHPAFYGLFEDDFFYYALVAKHLVLTHRSTFNGICLTNGYHPLWFLLVACCYAAFRGIGFFIAVQAAALVATFACYFGLLRCFAACQVAPALRRVLALALTLHALLLFRFGMEVTLLLPLAVWTLAFILSPHFHWSTRQTLAYGLLTSLTVLARLDAILLIALLIAAQLVTAKLTLAERSTRLALFLCGWLPFFLYLLLNHHVFHAWLPVSGAAKQLKPLWPPSLVPAESFLFPFDRTKAAFVYPAVLVSLLGALQLIRSWPRSDPRSRYLLAALLLFPAVHIAVLCLLSDWTVWPWYYYSLSLSTLAAAILLLRRLPAGQATRNPRLALAAASAALVLYIAAYAIFKHPARPMLFFAAEFERSHPGIYAMGDGSGTPSYFGDSPVIQLEGLVMDAEYIRLLRAQPPLRQILERYHVDYYVTFGLRHTPGCHAISEPAQGGRRSPHARGRICAPPLASIREDNLQLDVYRASDVLLP